jgi:DnaJ-class molecular chaperone
MSSPYEILGIPQNADEAALREAYRRLARACGGDARRLRELDDAYDAIILSRGHGAFKRQDPERQARGAAPAEFGDIRRQLHAGRFDDALTLLDGMPPHLRDAQWHYLKGCAQRGRGWLEEAERNFAQASRMAPENGEYRAARDQMREDRDGGQRGKDDNDMCCKVCAGMACLDCLCECCR